MLSGLFRGSQSVAVGGPIGSLKDAKTMSSNPNFDAAYLASRLGATTDKSVPLDVALTDRYKGDIVNSMDVAQKTVYLQNAVKGYESEAEECLKKEFKDWLAGAHIDNKKPLPYTNEPGRLQRRNARGELMNDWHPTWWGTRQLTHLNGVKEYLRKDYEDADKENFKMNMLAQFGPQNLDEAWAYFKYWVKRHPVGPEKCLSESGASEFTPPTTHMLPADIPNLTMREPLTLSTDELEAYRKYDDELVGADMSDKSNLIKLAARLATKIPRNVDSREIKDARLSVGEFLQSKVEDGELSQNFVDHYLYNLDNDWKEVYKKDKAKRELQVKKKQRDVESKALEEIVKDNEARMVKSHVNFGGKGYTNSLQRMLDPYPGDSRGEDDDKADDIDKGEEAGKGDDGEDGTAREAAREAAKLPAKEEAKRKKDEEKKRKAEIEAELAAQRKASTREAQQKRREAAEKEAAEKEAAEEAEREKRKAAAVAMSAMNLEMEAAEAEEDELDAEAPDEWYKESKRSFLKAEMVYNKAIEAGKKEDVAIEARRLQVEIDSAELTKTALDKVAIVELQFLQKEIDEINETLKTTAAKQAAIQKQIDEFQKKHPSIDLTDAETQEYDELLKKKEETERQYMQLYNDKTNKLITKSMIIPKGGHYKMRQAAYQLTLKDSLTDEEIRLAQKEFQDVSTSVEEYKFELENVILMKMDRLKDRIKDLKQTKAKNLKEETDRQAQSAEFTRQIKSLDAQLFELTEAKRPKPNNPFKRDPWVPNPEHFPPERAPPLPEERAEQRARVEAETQKRKKQMLDERTKRSARNSEELEMRPQGGVADLRKGMAPIAPIAEIDDDEVFDEEVEGAYRADPEVEVATYIHRRKKYPDQILIGEYTFRQDNLRKAKDLAQPKYKYRFRDYYDPKEVTMEQLHEAFSEKDFQKVVDEMVDDLGGQVFTNRFLDLPTREAYKIELFDRVGPKDVNDVLDRLYMLQDDEYDVVDVRSQRMILDDREAFKKLIDGYKDLGRYTTEQDQIPLHENPEKLLRLAEIYLETKPKMSRSGKEEFVLRVMRHSYYKRGQESKRITRRPHKE
jgi:hypothetical protein